MTVTAATMTKALWLLALLLVLTAAVAVISIATTLTHLG